MIEFMKGWVINISTAVFFIIAIEMILPSNSIKKYVKFVLGLILIVIIINPIMKVFSKEFNINNQINAASKYVDQNLYKNNYDEYKYKNMENTLMNFESNVENQCKKKLKEKYPNSKFEIKATVKFDEKINEFHIISLKIGITKNTNVKKIEIKTNLNMKKGKEEILNDNLSKNIKDYMSSEFKIPEKIIIIYRV